MYWDPRISNRDRNLKVATTISEWQKKIKGENIDRLKVVATGITEFPPSLDLAFRIRGAMRNMDNQIRSNSDADLYRDVEAIGTRLVFATEALELLTRHAARVQATIKNLVNILILDSHIEDLVRILRGVAVKLDSGLETTERYKRLLEKLGELSCELNERFG
jgi:hypothetical protein